jgi:hypothetical protein
MFKRLKSSFHAPGSPDPHEIAEAIAELVALPRGSRPARTVVGAAYGADMVNAQTAPVHPHVVEALGLDHLARIA